MSSYQNSSAHFHCAQRNVNAILHRNIVGNFTANALASNLLYVAAGLKQPRHKEIINAFNRGLLTIKADGSFLEIEKRYGLAK